MATRWDEEDTIRVGEGMVDLARQHQERLDARGITTEYLAECDVSLAASRAAASSKDAKLGAQRASTQALDALINRVRDRVVAIRNAIQRVHPDRDDLHAAFGVGTRAGGSVPAASKAVNLILEGAADHPAETAAATILEADLTTLAAIRDTMHATDKAQEQKKGAKLAATDTRDARLNDITERVDHILAAASLEFVEEPAIYGRFQALIPSKKADDDDKNGPPPQPAG